MSEPTLNIKTSAANSAATRKRICQHIHNTPLLPSTVYGANLLFKTENFQHTGSFKIRGALSKLTALAENNDVSQLKLITASSGNHGIGASLAASKLGAKMTVVLPENVAQMKLDKIKSLGATAILHSDDAEKAERHAKELSEQQGYNYISPYNDPDIIAGQGTIGLEILETLGDTKVDNIFIAMGGGGLISGIGAAIKNQSPNTKIWGVSCIHSAAFAASIQANKVVETEHKPTLADAVAGGVDEDTITLSLGKQVIDELIWCDEQEIETAIIDMALKEKQIVEGSAALALAAYTQVAKKLEGQKSIVLLCGANIDNNRLIKILSGAQL